MQSNHPTQLSRTRPQRNRRTRPHGQHAARSGGRMVLVVVLVIRSLRLSRHDGVQQQIVAQIPPDSDLSALDSLIEGQVHVVQVSVIQPVFAC
jgi:hypothetical protein